MKKILLWAILLFVLVLGTSWFYTYHESTFEKMINLRHQYVMLIPYDNDASSVVVEDPISKKPLIKENGDTVKLHSYDVIFVDKYSFDNYYYFTDWNGELTPEAGKQMRMTSGGGFEFQEGYIVDGQSIASDVSVKGLNSNGIIKLHEGERLVKFLTFRDGINLKTKEKGRFWIGYFTVIPNNEEYAHIKTSFSRLDDKLIAKTPLAQPTQSEYRAPLNWRIQFWLSDISGGHRKGLYIGVFIVLICFICFTGKWFDSGSAGSGEMLLNTFAILFFMGVLAFYLFNETIPFWFIDPDRVGWIKSLIYFVVFIFIIMCLFASLCRTQKCFNNKIGTNKAHIFGWGIIILFVTGAISCLTLPEGALVYFFGLVLNFILLFRMLYHGFKGDWGISILETICWALTFICLASFLGIIIVFVASLVIKLISWTILFFFVGYAIAKGGSAYSDVSSDQLYPMGYGTFCSQCPYFDKQGNEGERLGHCKHHSMICNQDMTCGWNVEQNKPSLYKQHMNYLEMERTQKEMERKQKEENDKSMSRNYKR